MRPTEVRSQFVDSDGDLKKRADHWCVFHDTSKGCTVYEARPDTCRNYMPPDCKNEAFVAKPTLTLAEIMNLKWPEETPILEAVRPNQGQRRKDRRKKTR